MGMRGIVGIEAAIVLIAFVLVASALAFVAINMGMFASQKSKEIMARAYESSTKSLDVAGNALGKVVNVGGTVGDEAVSIVYIPVKLTGGARPIDLSKTVVSVLLQLPNGTSKALAQAVNSDALTSLSVISSLDEITFKDPVTNVTTNATWATAQGNDNLLLEPGEVVILAINASDILGAAGLPAYSNVEVEIKPSSGATIVVRYEVPPTLTSEYVDLIMGG